MEMENTGQRKVRGMTYKGKGHIAPPKTMSLVLVDRIQTFWRGRWNNGVNMASSFAPAWLSRAF